MNDRTNAVGIYILFLYVTKLKKRENNHFTFHFSGINILASKNLKREELIIDMTDCIRSLLINCGHLRELLIINHI